MTLARPLAGTLVTLALAAGVTACGGSSSTPSAAGSSAPSSGQSGGPKPDGGGAYPLDAYLGAGGGTTVVSSATQQRKYQEAIARCMAAQGFDYVPEPAARITE